MTADVKSPPPADADSSTTSDRSALLQLMINQLQHYELNSLAAQVADATSLDPTHRPSTQLADLVAAGRAALAAPKAEPTAAVGANDSSTGSSTALPTTAPLGPWGPCFEPPLAGQPPPAPAAKQHYNEIFHTSHKMACSTASFSLDGRYVATGSYDASLKVLDVAKMYTPRTEMGDDGKPLIRTFYDHADHVNEVTVHPNGRVLASCSDDCNIKLYDLQRVGGKRAFRFLQDQSPVNSVSFHPSGDYILGAMESGPIRLYDVRYLKCYGPLSPKDAHSGPVNKVRYSFMGDTYISCGVDGTIKLWDGVSGHCTKTIEHAHHGTEVLSVCLSKNGRFALSTGRDSEPKLWDMRMGKILRTYPGVIQRAHSTNAAFSWNEDYVLSPDEVTGDVVVWCTHTATVLTRVSGHVGPVRAVVPSPVNNSFMSCGEDMKARFHIAAGEKPPA